jgi:glycosyltransferase involved in cell wall biosynthesis
MPSRPPVPGPLVLDLQALQSEHHRDRGIGRWAFEFTLALAEARPDLVGAILLNAHLPDPPEADTLRTIGPVGRVGETDLSRARIFHSLSPFELDQDVDGIWPRSIRESPIELVVTLYDLIPEVFPARYLADVGQRRRYRARCELIRAAGAVLAISGATRAEAIGRLGLHPEQVSSVGAGISPQFTAPASRTEALEKARAAVDRLAPSFILSVGGEDDRKNLEGLLAGFARLPAEVRAHRQLVIACRLGDGYKAHLRAVAHTLGIGPRLLLPGFVDDATLVALYQSTELFVFPSLYEGFGLPVAEAMACGAPVVASNTSATAEVASPAGQFDPSDPASMAEAMRRALTDAPTAAALARASAAPPPTWAEVAAKAIPVYERLLGPVRVAGSG